MHKKINVDYIRNKLNKLELPAVQLQLPNIKTGKISCLKTSKRSEQNEQSPSSPLPPPLPKVPPPTIVDRSPIGISTISALVDGAPTYDYSFGGATVSQEFYQEQHQQQQHRDRNIGDETIAATSTGVTTKRKGFSEKFTKHYKELSEFKFKNILGKKTVVKKTDIQVDMYAQRFEDEHQREGFTETEHSEYEFDVRSETYASSDHRLSLTPPLVTAKSLSDLTITGGRGGGGAAGGGLRGMSSEDDTFHDIEEIKVIEPIDSSLYRIKQRAESMESMESKDLSSSVNLSTTVPGKRTFFKGFSQDKQKSISNETSEEKKSSHLRTIDDAYNRAKKAVNIRFLKRGESVESSSSPTGKKTPIEKEKEKPQQKTSSDDTTTTLEKRFDDACDRAKKRVGAKWQKLLQLRDKYSSQDTSAVPVDPDAPAAPALKRKSEIRRKSPKEQSSMITLSSIKQRSIESESLNSSREDASADYYSKQYHEWGSSKRILSVESIDEQSPPPSPSSRCLKSQYTIDSNDEFNEEEALVIHRPAPPIPKIQPILNRPPQTTAIMLVLSNKNQSITPTTADRAELASILKVPSPNSIKGHNRKPSMDSVDSDSWIPETFKTCNRPQIGLNKIEENIEPWLTKQMSNNQKKLLKTKSIDIFAGEVCEKVFDDFDDVFKDVPVIPIPEDEVQPPQPLLPHFKYPSPPPATEEVTLVKVEHYQPKSLIKQTSLTKQFSDNIEAENLNINVNKLISQFEPNTIDDNGENASRVPIVTATVNINQSNQQIPTAKAPKLIDVKLVQETKPEGIQHSVKVDVNERNQETSKITLEMGVKPAITGNTNKIEPIQTAMVDLNQNNEEGHYLTKVPEMDIATIRNESRTKMENPHSTVVVVDVNQNNQEMPPSKIIEATIKPGIVTSTIQATVHAVHADCNQNNRQTSIEVVKPTSNWEQNSMEDNSGVDLITSESSTETIKSDTTVIKVKTKSGRITSKEWARRAKASRSLERGALGSEDIFYSFDNGNNVTKSASSPQNTQRRKAVRKQVYRVDL